jgi:hypothetical protein
MPDEGVECVETGEHPPVQQAAVEITDGPLNLAFCPGPAGPVRRGQEAVMRGKIAELRVQLPQAGAHLLHVVVKDAPGHPAQIPERLLVAREQRRQRHRRGEAHEQRP